MPCTVAGEVMFYLGIDPSVTNTGCVLLNKDAEIISFINAGRQLRHKAGFLRYIEQAEKIRDWALENTNNETLYVGYENYSYGSEHKLSILAEYGGVLKYCMLAGLKINRFLLVSPSENKKFATGSGGASKQAVAAMAPEQLRTESNDITDAYFLALYAAVNNNINLAQCPRHIELALRPRNFITLTE